MPTIQIGDQEIDVNVGPEGAEFGLGDGGKIKVDGQGRLVGAEAFGNTIQKVEGGMLITRANGSQFLMGDDGNQSLLTMPKSIGIRDMSNVASYTISKNSDGSTHRVTFEDGGYANVEYTLDGKIAGFSGHHLSQSLNEENEMLVWQFPENPEKAE